MILDLNSQGFENLDDIYNALLIKNTRTKTPKFCSPHIKLPLVNSSEIFDIQAQDFLA